MTSEYDDALLDNSVVNCRNQSIPNENNSMINNLSVLEKDLLLSSSDSDSDDSVTSKGGNSPPTSDTTDASKYEKISFEGYETDDEESPCDKDFILSREEIELGYLTGSSLSSEDESDGSVFNHVVLLSKLGRVQGKDSRNYLGGV